MHFRLVDANSVGYALHHAAEPRHVGELQTQAISGMMTHFKSSLAYEPNSVNVVVWDGRAQWRYDLHPGYKQGRHRTPEQRETRALYEAQRPWMRKILALFPVLQVCHPGAEADDLAWGLCHQLTALGHLVTVYSVDADWFQMVSQRSQWKNARKPHQVVGLDGFTVASGGYPRPGAVAAVKALSGDTSDDIEGLPDVAIKRAGALIHKYGSIEGALNAAEDFLTFSAEPKHYHTLMIPKYRELVERNLKLIDLARGPTLNGGDVELTEGNFNDLELLLLILELDLKQWEENLEGWCRPLGRALKQDEVHTFKRALENLEKSWT